MPIKHYLGLQEYALVKKNEKSPVFYEPDKLINGHMLLCGMSGTGKSFQAKRFLSAASSSGVEVDIMDVHEELHGLTGSVACKYSQATGFGYNPLVLDTDIHSGGVDAQVNFIVKLIRDVTPAFGPKQEAALRYLLTDVYAISGIYQKDTRTWVRKEMTESERESLIDQRKWSELKQYYPTLEDLKSFAKRKIIALTIGGDNKSITSFEHLRRTKGKLSQLQGKYAKAADDAEIERLAGLIQAQKSECIEAYAAFIEAMKTGKEIDDVMKYDSVEVLSSVLQRIDILMSASGLFRSNPPPFGGARVRCHQIKSVSTPQQVMFVKLRLRDIFEKCKHAGATESGTEIRHIVFLDEAHKFFSDEPDDIINVIAKEGRKFGLALWCASQQPTEFPESFLTNVGATVLLGIHSSFWKGVTSKMRITEEQLKFIKAKEVMSIKLQRDGAADPPFYNIVVPNPVSANGRLASEFAR